MLIIHIPAMDLETLAELLRDPNFNNDWNLNLPWEDFFQYYKYHETPYTWIALGIQNMVRYACAIPKTAKH